MSLEMIMHMRQQRRRTRFQFRHRRTLSLRWQIIPLPLPLRSRAALLRSANTARQIRRPSIPVVGDIVVREGISSALTGQEPCISRPVGFILHRVQTDILIFTGLIGARALGSPEVDVAAGKGDVVCRASDWDGEAVDVANVDVVGTGGAAFDFAVG